MATLLNYTVDSASGTNPDALYKLTAVESARTSSTVTIKFTAYGKLEASSHWLGTGHTLTAAVYVGGSWYSWTLKKSTVAWEGTTAHSASKSVTIDVTASQTSVTGIKFKVTHSGGTSCPLSSRSVSSLTISTGNSKSSLTISNDKPLLGGIIMGTIKPVTSTNYHTISIIRSTGEDVEEVIANLGTISAGTNKFSYIFSSSIYGNLFAADDDELELLIRCTTYSSSGTALGSYDDTIHVVISENIGRPSQPSVIISTRTDTSATIDFVEPSEYKYGATFGSWEVTTNNGVVSISGDTATINWTGNETIVASIIAIDSRGLKSKPVQVVCSIRKKGFCVYNGKWKQASPYVYQDGQYKRLHGAVYNGSWLKYYYRGLGAIYLTDESGNFLTDESDNILRL